MTEKRALLVMPLGFYSFAKVFAEGLRELGYAVETANDEYPANPIGRAMGKLDLAMCRWLTRRKFLKRILPGKRWDLIVIIKGRGIGPELVVDMKKHATRVVGYHFDALAYDPSTSRWGKDVDRVTTFDYRDAQERGWPLVELFSSQASPDSTPDKTIRVSAIQRNHSGRLRFLDQVLDVFGEGNSFVFLFEKDWGTFAVNALRSPYLYWKWRKHISRTALPYERYREVLAASEFTIDFAHPHQTGATMRSFEALALGTKLVTSNSWMLEGQYFGDHNTVVFDPRKPEVLRARVDALTGIIPLIHCRSPIDVLNEIIGSNTTPSVDFAVAPAKGGTG